MADSLRSEDHPNNDTAAAAPHDAMILRSLLGERGVRVR